MQINRLMFFEMGTYCDQVIRPYSIGGNLNQRHLRELQETTRCGSNLTASNLSGIAGQFLRPAAEVQGVAMIANAWDTPRFRFLLEVSFVDPFGGGTVQYLGGYTNHVGVSHGGFLDPNMEMFFNTSIETRMAPTLGFTGNVMAQRVTNSAHVLSGTYMPSYGHLGNTTHSMRPEDVFHSSQLQELLDYDADIVVDTRTAFSEQRLRKSVRSNTSAPTYLSRLLSTHKAEVNDAEENKSWEDMMNEAAGVVREPTITHDAFLHELSLRSRLMQGGFVTYGELCGIQPGLDQYVEVGLARGVHAQELHRRGETSHWTGSDHETIMATILTHGVTALMAENMLTVVGFVATNRTINGTDIFPSALATFTKNVDMKPFIDNFYHRLQFEILRDLSQNNMIDYHLNVYFDLLGQSTITIAVGGGPAITYTSASFADSLFVPVLTNAQQNLTDLAGDITTIAESLQTDYSPRRNPEVTHGTFGAL